MNNNSKEYFSNDTSLSNDSILSCIHVSDPRSVTWWWWCSVPSSNTGPPVDTSWSSTTYSIQRFRSCWWDSYGDYDTWYAMSISFGTLVAIYDFTLSLMAIVTHPAGNNVWCTPSIGNYFKFLFRLIIT